MSFGFRSLILVMTAAFASGCGDDTEQTPDGGGGSGAEGEGGSMTSTISSMGGGGGDGCMTLELEPVAASTIEWSGFPACDPRSDICIVHPAPMPALGPASVSPSGKVFSVWGTTVAAWKDGVGEVWRLPIESHLSGVAAISDTDVWVVGEGSTVLHFDGTTWTPFDIENPSALGAIWANASDDVWIAGNFGIAAHWNGSTWTEHEVDGTAAFFVISATGPNDAWAAGDEGPVNGVFHFDGAGWTLIPVDSDAWMDSIYAASPTDVWLVGDGELFRGNADGFALVDLPFADVSVTSVWGSSPNDVWVMAYDAALHYDGATWTRFDPVGTYVTGYSSTDVLAIGDAAMRWDGATWSEELRISAPDLNDVWAVSEDEVWFVGDAGAVYVWKDDELFHGTLGQGRNPTVWGSSASDVWIGYGAGVLHGDGTTFCEVELPSHTGYMTDIAGSGPDDVWAVWDSGAVMHFDGSEWSLSLSEEGYVSVLAFSPTDAWLTGENLRHWDGTEWKRPATTFFGDSEDEGFGPIWGASPNDVWVARHEFLEGTYMAHWDGTTFALTEFDADDQAPIVGRSATDIWSLGFNVTHFDGTAWTKVPTGRLQPRAAAATSTDVWAVGYAGLIMRHTK